MALLDQRERTTVTASPEPVLWLDQAMATSRALSGAKAANLAVARRRGLATVPGFVVTVADAGAHPDEPSGAVRTAWERLSHRGRCSLVVRSSATSEDLEGSSMAGQYTSVVDVRGWREFVDAYREVVASADGAGGMAVLVQELVRPELGGVLFGVDPVTGRRDRLVVAAVAGGPQALVSGSEQGRRSVLTRSGRVVAADGDPTPVLSGRERRRLVRLADAAQAVFGGPQDVEWAVDGGRLLLLQSRPITAVAEPGTGPVLGPGPVGETFPEPLSTLEADLWVPPLRAATAATLVVTGSAGRRRVARSPVVTVVDGWVVADLDLTGLPAPRRRVVELLDPRPPLRRLAAAWDVGRLRGSLATISSRVIDAVDHELAAFPDPATLTDDELLRLLRNAAGHLRSLHGHEMLVGALLAPDGSDAAGAALHAIADGRSRGWSDDDIVARSPIALAVVTPGLGDRSPLPEVREAPEPSGHLSTREQLRLRIRWIHELTRQVAREIGRRMEERGTLARATDVGRLPLAVLESAVQGGHVAVPEPEPAPQPVPSRFRLSAGGAVVAEPATAGAGGVGASGGRAVGPVTHGDPGPGDVLVVQTLDPALAPALATAAAVVAETGSVLSHLAILARERGVPVVVGYDGARNSLRPGAWVSVDGASGAVEVLDGDGGPSSGGPESENPSSEDPAPGGRAR
jgi:rifampicin phosphotransferase